jgi:hypothetical protein
MGTATRTNAAPPLQEPLGADCGRDVDVPRRDSRAQSSPNAALQLLRVARPPTVFPRKWSAYAALAR